MSQFSENFTLLKSHIEAYTRKNGVVVQAHDDSRVATHAINYGGHDVDSMLPAASIKPINGIEDKEKFRILVDRMRSTGWAGRPVLAYKEKGKVKAVTGSHRIAAAKKLGIDIPVVFIPDSTVNFKDDTGSFASFKDAVNDQRLSQFFKFAGDQKSQRLADDEDRDYGWQKSNSK